MRTNSAEIYACRTKPSLVRKKSSLEEGVIASRVFWHKYHAWLRTAEVKALVYEVRGVRYKIKNDGAVGSEGGMPKFKQSVRVIM